MCVLVLSEHHHQGFQCLCFTLRWAKNTDLPGTAVCPLCELTKSKTDIPLIIPNVHGTSELCSASPPYV